MFERYTTRARRAIYFARSEALHRQATEIDTQDIALGLTRDPHTKECPFHPLHERATEWRALFQAGSADFLKPQARNLPLSKASKKALAYAELEAKLDGRYAIDGEHLLRGILRVGDLTAERLAGAGWNLNRTREASAACQRIVPDMKRPWHWWLRKYKRKLVLLIVLVPGIAAIFYLRSQR